MMQHQAKIFIERLTGRGDTAIHWQIFHDSNKSENFAKSIYASHDDEEHTLFRFQQEGCGIYITINETDGVARQTGNIKSCRACFIDGDNQNLPQQWGCYPNMIVGRNNTQWHAYWFIDPTTDFEKWRKFQYQLGIYYRVKDRIHDLPRVMRAPGYYHLKDPLNPQLYQISYDNPGRYDLNNLIDLHQLDSQQQQEYFGWIRAPKSIKYQTKIFCENDVTLKRFNSQLQTIKPEQGNYNNSLYVAASAGKDLGITPETVRTLLTDWWQETWPIPVELSTIAQVVDNAYQYGVNSAGSSTSQAIFSQCPSVDNVGSDEDLRIAIEGVADSDIKFGKNHTVNARIFLQMEEDAGIKYITYKRQTYRYEDTYWRKLEEKELDKILLNAMLRSRPTVDTVTSTCKIIALITARNDIEKVPCWLTESASVDPSNFIAFKNGILDPIANIWYKHTSDLFYTYCLDYDYDSSAKCDHWMTYLITEVFNCQSIISTLQEWMGYQLIHNYDYQKIALFLGAPRSGKGTISNVMREIIGRRNVASPTLSGLIKDANLEAMDDKPVGIIGDAHTVNFRDREAVLERIKMISGGDAITYSRKFIGSATTRFPTRFTLCANEFPDFLDSSGALATRLIIFPFRNSYVGREDPHKLDKLLLEKPGILNWALMGLRRLRMQQKFTESEEMVKMMRMLKEDMSPVSAFIEDCLHVSGYETDIILAQDLYQVYRRWCNNNDRSCMSSGKFRKQLLSANYAIHYSRTSIPGRGRPRIFTGIYLLNSYTNELVNKFNASNEPGVPGGDSHESRA